MGNTQVTGRSSQGLANSKEESDKMDEEMETDDSGTEPASEYDISCLFHSEAIFKECAETRDIAKKVAKEECYIELRDALDCLQRRSDIDTINFSRFCDMVSSLQLSHEKLLEIFDVLDYEGRGAFEVLPVLHALRKNKKISPKGNVNLVLLRFKDCSWLPGIVDLYADQKNGYKQRGLNILDFLLRNRVTASKLHCAQKESFVSLMKLRDKIVKAKMKAVNFSSGQETHASMTKKAILKKDVSLSGDHLVPDEEDEGLCIEFKADEALVLWFMQLVTTTAKASLPQAPEHLTTALNHIRVGMSRLLPLSLSYDSEQRPSFMNSDCLHEMASLMQLFPEQDDVLNLLLNFHLSCGSVSDILQILIDLNASTKKIDCNKLLLNMGRVRSKLLRNNSHLLKVSILGCDSEGSDKDDPNSIVEAHWKQRAFSTQPGERKANFMFESSKWMEITSVKIKKKKVPTATLR